MNKNKNLSSVFLVAMLIMTIFEATKQLLLGNISLYVSHGITIVFTSVMAVFIGNYLINYVHKYCSKVHELYIYNEKIKNDVLAKDLLYAKELQASMIPSSFPLFPDRGDFDCYGYYMSAGYVGGDFYDIFFIDSHRICFLIGDVCGKGIPAAILMTKCMNILHYEAQHHADPADMLYNLNNQLAHNNTQLLFVTAFCAVLDLNSGKLVYSNAGQNPPIIIRNGNDPGAISATPPFWSAKNSRNKVNQQADPWNPLELTKIPNSLVLGIKKDHAYEATTTYMKQGDAIVMYTDGVTEAMNRSKLAFGEERLMGCLGSLDCIHPKLIVNSVTSTLSEFVNNDSLPSDDIAIFSLYYKGNQNLNTCLIATSPYCGGCVERRISDKGMYANI